MLRAASSSARVDGRTRADPLCNIFGYTIPYLITCYVAEQKLPEYFLTFRAGFSNAGEACRGGWQLFNSAGIEPRLHLERCGMTLENLRVLLKVVADNQVDDNLVNNYWCWYAWFGCWSRYGEGRFDNDEVSWKAGDTFYGPRFRSSVANQSPAAARYGGKLAKTMISECYLEAYGCRGLRGLSELYLCWACRDELDDYGFYEDRSCGQEGLRGPLDKAEDALRRMYDVVRGDDVLAGIFSIEQGYREGDSKWEREIFKKRPSHVDVRAEQGLAAAQLRLLVDQEQHALRERFVYRGAEAGDDLDLGFSPGAPRASHTPQQHLAPYTPWGRGAHGLVKTQYISTTLDLLIALWYATDRGTQDGWVVRINLDKVPDVRTTALHTRAHCEHAGLLRRRVGYDPLVVATAHGEVLLSGTGDRDFHIPPGAYASVFVPQSDLAAVQLSTAGQQMTAREWVALTPPALSTSLRNRLGVQDALTTADAVEPTATLAVAAATLPEAAQVVQASQQAVQAESAACAAGAAGKASAEDM